LLQIWQPLTSPINLQFQI